MRRDMRAVGIFSQPALSVKVPRRWLRRKAATAAHVRSMRATRFTRRLYAKRSAVRTPAIFAIRRAPNC